MTTLCVDVGTCLCQTGQEGPGHRGDAARVPRREAAGRGSHLVPRGNAARGHAVSAVLRPVVLGCAWGSAHDHPASVTARGGGKPPARLPSLGPATQHAWTGEAVDLRGPPWGVAEWGKCARLGAGRGGLGSRPAPRLLGATRPQGRGCCWPPPPRGARTPHPQPRLGSGSPSNPVSYFQKKQTNKHTISEWQTLR